MDIGVVCNPHIRMAEQAGYNLDVYFIGEQLTGKGVPQSVDADMGYPGPFQNTIVRPVEISRFIGFPLALENTLGKRSFIFCSSLNA